MQASLRALLAWMLFSIALLANDCPKWFPMPALDGYVVVVPIYPAGVTGSDLDCDGIIDDEDDDIDGDGVPNDTDAFPRDASESVDTDGDGIGNNADTDDDNDGYSDADEIAAGSDPLDPNSIPAVNGDALFSVTPISGTSSQVSFGVSLKSRPDANVTVTFHSDDETTAKPTTNTIVFTPENWYRYRYISVDIFNPNTTIQIVFDPAQSDDVRYQNKRLSPVDIVSHMLKLFEPADHIVYSEFNMSIPLAMAYVGDSEENISVTLEQAPNGMVWDVQTHRLLWHPDVTDEGSDVSVQVRVSDGLLSDTKTFELHVAQPRALQVAIADGKLEIVDNNSSLKGLTVTPVDANVSLVGYRLFALDVSDTPSLPQNEQTVGEALLVKGNIGKKVKMTLPLQGLVSQEELLSFHTKSYYGSGSWRRIDYDYDFNGTASAPVYSFRSEGLFGVVSFTKEMSATQTKTVLKKAKRSNRSTTSIHCAPQTWSFLNLTDYDNQICTFDDKPDFRLQIFNYPDAAIADTTSIEEVASWIRTAQTKLDALNMPYRNDGALSFERINETHGHTKPIESPAGSLFVKYPQFNDFLLSKINKYLSVKKEVELTVYHEYFHQSQSAIQNNTVGVLESRWLIESSAVWFSDYVDYNSGYAYQMAGLPLRLLSYGLPRVRTFITGSEWTGRTQSTKNSTKYQRGLFLEMIEKYCPNFTSYIPYLFYYDDTDKSSLQHLSNVIYSSSCNFGTPTGSGNESRIETALLYYQFIASMKQNINLITNFGIHAGYETHEENSLIIKLDNWNALQLNSYQNMSNRVDWLNKSIDSQTKTIYVEKVNTSLPKCQERYIRIKSEKTILVSFASNDSLFPDTPNTMLGDMKQINFGMIGQTDFTYFYDPNTGKQVFPEMYLTIIDVVDDTATLTPQQIELGIGLRRNNLLSHINGNDMCAEYVPPISQYNVTANGDIPSQYRDINQPLKYIDRIKITCLESGEVFNATVANDGTWSTNIHITFNGNQSRFSIKGYNSANPDRIIANQGLLIVR